MDRQEIGRTSEQASKQASVGPIDKLTERPTDRRVSFGLESVVSVGKIINIDQFVLLLAGQQPARLLHLLTRPTGCLAARLLKSFVPRRTNKVRGPKLFHFSPQENVVSPFLGAPSGSPSLFCLFFPQICLNEIDSLRTERPRFAGTGSGSFSYSQLIRLPRRVILRFRNKFPRFHLSFQSPKILSIHSRGREGNEEN